MGPSSLLHRFKNYFSETIWEVHSDRLSRPRRAGIYLCRIVAIIGAGMAQHKLPVRSTALAYTTILSIVPLLAVTFALFKAFGALEKLMGPIKQFILSNLATGSGSVAVAYLDQFIENYHSGTIGVVGFLVLLLAVIALLTTIEKAFNDIWGIPKARSFIKRLTAYWSLITIGPVLLGVSLTVTAALQSSTLVQEILSFSGMEKFLIAKIPYLTTWALFTALYLIMPNTRVRVRSALIGGLVGAILWEAAKYGYTLYAAKAVLYSKVYGSLGIFPIFLIWTYYSWVVVLIGAEIAFADQNIHTYRLEKKVGKVSYGLTEQAALAILQFIGGRFYRNDPPPTAHDISESLELPLRLVNTVLDELVSGGFLVEVGEEESAYVPGRPMSTTTVAEVIQYLRNYGEQRLAVSVTPEANPAYDLLKKIETASLEPARSVTLEGLIKSRPSS